jgi:hypothetical protein
MLIPQEKYLWASTACYEDSCTFYVVNKELACVADSERS